MFATGFVKLVMGTPFSLGGILEKSRVWQALAMPHLTLDAQWNATQLLVSTFWETEKRVKTDGFSLACDIENKKMMERAFIKWGAKGRLKGPCVTLETILPSYSLTWFPMPTPILPSIWSPIITGFPSSWDPNPWHGPPSWDPHSYAMIRFHPSCDPIPTPWTNPPSMQFSTFPLIHA
jgi:hypothetical protein